MSETNQVITFDQATHTELMHCLWMQAGVVDYKLCDREYDCEHCPFDEAFHRPATHVSISLDRHHDMGEMRKASTPTISVRGCEVASNLFYHPGHTWARIEEGGIVRAGLDDFGQRMLGPAYSLTLPSPNTTVQRGAECWRFTHQSGVTALVAPVSGKVREVNSTLLLRPALLNRDPYGEGWAILIEPGDLKSCLKRLMYGEQVRRWFAAEIEKLRLLINTLLDDGPAPKSTMTDGGLLSREFMSELTVAQMRRVIDSFFPLPPVEEAEHHNAILVQKGR